jgi:hypothetical protein
MKSLLVFICAAGIIPCFADPGVTIEIDVFIEQIIDINDGQPGGVHRCK